MTKPSKADTVSQDFAQVTAFLAKRHFTNQPDNSSLSAALRRIHFCIYGLSIWSHFLKIAEHGQVYLNELASDAMQILPHASIGFKKSSRLLTRGIIENLMRHVYFADHPVEYARQNMDARWYMSAEQLFDYARNHPVFSGTEKKYNALGRLRQLYSELSAEVHGGRAADLDQYVALKDLKLDIKVLGRQVSLLEDTAANTNFVLLVFHSDNLGKIPKNFQRVLFSTMPKKARQGAKGIA